MARPSSLFRIAASALVCGWLGFVSADCTQANQSYALRSLLSPRTYPEAAEVQGELSVERIEGGLRLVVVQLSMLPAPERLAPGLKEFVVWLLPPSGATV